MEDTPSVHNALISRNLGKLWREQPEEVKKPFHIEAKRLRLQHMRDFPDYKYKPKKKVKTVIKEEGLKLMEYTSPIAVPAEQTNSPKKAKKRKTSKVFPPVESPQQSLSSVVTSNRVPPLPVIKIEKASLPPPSQVKIRRNPTSRVSSTSFSLPVVSSPRKQQMTLVHPQTQPLVTFQPNQQYGTITFAPGHNQSSANQSNVCRQQAVPQTHLPQIFLLSPVQSSDSCNSTAVPTSSSSFYQLQPNTTYNVYQTPPHQQQPVPPQQYQNNVKPPPYCSSANAANNVRADDVYGEEDAVNDIMEIVDNELKNDHHQQSSFSPAFAPDDNLDHSTSQSHHAVPALQPQDPINDDVTIDDDVIQYQDYHHAVPEQPSYDSGFFKEDHLPTLELNEIVTLGSQSHLTDPCVHKSHFEFTEFDVPNLLI